ncbi:MAG TPA: thioredoxin family protein [Patescibacteria group bacterium]|nr:thioredoxin family protein [Patescibacteria group bacterium]
MARQQTPATEFGAKPHDFSLSGVDGKTWRLADIQGPKGFVVMFISNHCPFVKAIAARLAADMKELQDNGIGVIAIMPNDVANYPADSFENMKAFAADHGFTFPYVIDETQETAKAYGAVCTPDFFGYNGHGDLQYRGRLDDVTPTNPATGETRRDLVEAMLTIAATGRGPDAQTPSIGCGIKWKSA